MFYILCNALNPHKVSAKLPGNAERITGEEPYNRKPRESKDFCGKLRIGKRCKDIPPKRSDRVLGCPYKSGIPYASKGYVALDTHENSAEDADFKHKKRHHAPHKPREVNPPHDSTFKLWIMIHSE